jgi:hypothetical protein
VFVTYLLTAFEAPDITGFRYRTEPRNKNFTSRSGRRGEVTPAPVDVTSVPQYPTRSLIAVPLRYPGSLLTTTVEPKLVFICAVVR